MQTPPRTPPRFVPTLTEVVPNLPLSEPVPPAPSTPYAAVQQQMASDIDTPSTPPDILATGALEDQIIHRVMQRVDLSLERRLQEAVSAMVLSQTQSLVPRLREEIEFVVRQSVSDAVADELATRSNPR